MSGDLPKPPLEYHKPTPPRPRSSLVRFAIIVPLTIVFFFLFLAAIVITILPDVSLPARIGAAAVLAAGFGSFVYWLAAAYRKKHAGTPPMTLKQKFFITLIILAIAGVRVLLHVLFESPAK